MKEMFALIILVGIVASVTFPLWASADLTVSDILNLEATAQSGFVTPQDKKVEYLFTDESGCKVYRFWDGGVDAAYYANCGGSK